MPEAYRVQTGVSIDHTPAADVAAGQVVIVNGTAGVAPIAIPANTLGAIDVEGVFDFASASGTLIGDRDNVFWDDTNNLATPTNTGVRLGKATRAKANGETVVRVKLGMGGTGRLATAAVAPAGSTQADAAALLEGFAVVTGADGTKGVKLPAPAAGAVVEIKNVTAAVLKVYPATGQAINAIAANGSLNMAASTSCRLICGPDGATWYSIPLLPS